MIAEACTEEVAEPVAPTLNGGRRGPVVCQVLHSLHVGGAEMLAARLARQLRDDCRFHFVCLEETGTLGEELRNEGFAVTVLGRRPGLDGTCAWRLARLLRGYNTDILHAHQYTPFFYSLVARLLCRRPPILFTEHGRHFPDFPRRKRMLVNRLLLERRDRVVGVGKAVGEALIANEGIPRDRVGIIYNGIDTNKFARQFENPTAIRSELGLTDADFVILMVARLDYLKDHATAVRCLHRLLKQVPNAKLILVGEGPEQEKIEAVVHESQLQNHVRFLGLRKDIHRLLSASDVFLLTSISEGIPLTVIEAMATRLPVVATRVGGMAEVIEHESTGFLSDSGDADGLAAHLRQLASEPILRRRLGEAGQDRAQRLFSEGQMHARYLALYRELAPVRN